MLHFTRAATGGQPEGGSRPQTSQKRGARREHGEAAGGEGCWGSAVDQAASPGGSGQFHLLEKVQQRAGDAQAGVVQLSAGERNFMSVQ